MTPYRDDAEWAIAVSRSELAGARDGEVVAVAPLERPRRRAGKQRLPSRGRVLEVLGRPGDAEADFRALVWRHALPEAFPEAALREAEELPDEIDAASRAQRIDLRQRPFVTIDPASARDHDDAICVEPVARGWRLWVAIADVSHYVAEGSAIDREALRRGNSVYFPGRAIPMLPERLSSDLCSLRPERERLAFTVELAVERSGRVTRRSFYPALLRSRARLVYEDAARAMQGDAEAVPDPGIARQLGDLRELSEALGRRRREAGSIDFDLPSAEVVLGPEGRPREIGRAPRTAAHRAVEEAMLAANRAVAETLEEAGAPVVFRNHEAPLEEDLEELGELFAGLGLFRGDPRELLDPGRLAALLARVAGRPEERLVNQMVLRGMRQACYGAQSRGHYALAFAHYLHFTSPIRRFADLVAHRALRALLDPGAGPAPAPRGLERLAVRLSERERLAVEAEREMLDLKQCAYMAERVGQEFEGRVSGVAPHGLYVTLEEAFVDGLLHVSRLPGRFDPDARGHALVARRGGARYRLGDRLRVRVSRVDPVKAYVNFDLANDRDRRSSQRTSRS